MIKISRRNLLKTALATSSLVVLPLQQVAAGPLLAPNNTAALQIVAEAISASLQKVHINHGICTMYPFTDNWLELRNDHSALKVRLRQELPDIQKEAELYCSDGLYNDLDEFNMDYTAQIVYLNHLPILQQHANAEFFTALLELQV